MFYYKLLSPEVHALHLEVPNKTFLETWTKTIEDRNQNIDQLVELLKPYIEHWVKLLTKEIRADVQLVTLYQYLEALEIPDAIETWLEDTDDIRSDLTYILIKTIKGFSYFPEDASPIKVEYVFALYYIRNLKQYLKVYKPFIIEQEPTLEPHEDHYPDHSLIRAIGSDPWTNYLLFLMTNGFNAMEIATISKIPRETFYYEELHIWQRLKKLWQLAEE